MKTLDRPLMAPGLQFVHDRIKLNHHEGCKKYNFEKLAQKKPELKDEIRKE